MHDFRAFKPGRHAGDDIGREHIGGYHFGQSVEVAMVISFLILADDSLSRSQIGS